MILLTLNVDTSNVQKNNYSYMFINRSIIKFNMKENTTSEIGICKPSDFIYKNAPKICESHMKRSMGNYIINILENKITMMEKLENYIQKSSPREFVTRGAPGQTIKITRLPTNISVIPYTEELRGELESLKKSIEISNIDKMSDKKLFNFFICEFDEYWNFIDNFYNYNNSILDDISSVNNPFENIITDRIKKDIWFVNQEKFLKGKFKCVDGKAVMRSPKQKKEETEGQPTQTGSRSPEALGIFPQPQKRLQISEEGTYRSRRVIDIDFTIKTKKNHL